MRQALAAFFLLFCVSKCVNNKSIYTSRPTATLLPGGGGGQSVFCAPTPNIDVGSNFQGGGGGGGARKQQTNIKVVGQLILGTFTF